MWSPVIFICSLDTVVPNVAIKIELENTPRDFGCGFPAATLTSE